MPYIYFSVADCTGHGVPGGFVSMVGITLLNELIRDGKDYKPAYILDQLRELVKTSLSQRWDNNEVKDGLDMSLCLYKPNSNELFFAGANSFMYQISDNDFIVHRGDNMPISIYYKEKPFSDKIISLGDNDLIYLFSDGYMDQFGGEDNKKFMRNNFKKLILSMKDVPFERQKNELHEHLLKWKKNQDQIDDITVVGVNLKKKN